MSKLLPRNKGSTFHLGGEGGSGGRGSCCCGLHLGDLAVLGLDGGVLAGHLLLQRGVLGLELFLGGFRLGQLGVLRIVSLLKLVVLGGKLAVLGSELLVLLGLGGEGRLEIIDLGLELGVLGLELGVLLSGGIELLGLGGDLALELLVLRLL